MKASELRELTKEELNQSLKISPKDFSIFDSKTRQTVWIILQDSRKLKELLLVSRQS